MFADNYFLNRLFVFVEGLQFYIRQLFKLLAAEVYFESQILLHNVFVDYFHCLIISGNINEKTDKYRQKLTKTDKCKMPENAVFERNNKSK